MLYVGVAHIDTLPLPLGVGRALCVGTLDRLGVALLEEDSLATGEMEAAVDRVCAGVRDAALVADTDTDVEWLASCDSEGAAERLGVAVADADTEVADVCDGVLEELGYALVDADTELLCVALDHALRDTDTEELWVALDVSEEAAERVGEGVAEIDTDVLADTEPDTEPDDNAVWPPDSLAVGDGDVLTVAAADAVRSGENDNSALGLVEGLGEILRDADTDTLAVCVAAGLCDTEAALLPDPLEEELCVVDPVLAAVPKDLGG